MRRLLGACRIPDPTTAGDFLRRFKTTQSIEQLSRVNDEVQEAVWSKLARTVRRRRKKQEFALIDLDGHIKPLYGVQKEGADFSYIRRWSYQPLVVSLGGSGECLKVINQPGSARPSDAAPRALKEVLPRVKRHFRNGLVRGDSDFDRSDIFIDDGRGFGHDDRYYEVVDQRFLGDEKFIGQIAERAPKGEIILGGRKLRFEKLLPAVAQVHGCGVSDLTSNWAAAGVR